jgi:hypothetical protein
MLRPEVFFWENGSPVQSSSDEDENIGSSEACEQIPF